MKKGNQIGFWYTTVHKCSIHGENGRFFVEKVPLLVHIAFVEVHSGNIKTIVFWYIWVFLLHFGSFLVSAGDFFGTKWVVFLVKTTHNICLRPPETIFFCEIYSILTGL